MIKVINLKEGIYPDVACYMLTHEIEVAKLSDVNVIIAIVIKKGFKKKTSKIHLQRYVFKKK